MLLPVSDNVDEMWSLFEETLTAAIEQFVPRSVIIMFGVVLPGAVIRYTLVL